MSPDSGHSGSGQGAAELAPLLENWGNFVAIIAAGFASGLAGAVAGKSSVSWMGYVRRFLSLDRLASLGTVVFMVMALIAGGLVVNQVAVKLEALAIHADLRLIGPAWFLFAAHGLVICALLAGLWGCGTVIDVNRFSLNGFYCNRLARAFLGAARVGPRLTPAEIEDRREPDFSPALIPRTTAAFTHCGRGAASVAVSHSFRS